MKLCNRKFIKYIILIILGVILTVCSFYELVDDYFGGLGCGCLAAGILQLIRCFRYCSDEGYREKTDISQQDERNHYLSLRAWSYSAYLFVIIGAVASIAFRIAGLNAYCLFAAFSICTILILYVICYFEFRARY